MSVAPRPVDERILSELDHARILGLMRRTPLSEAQKHALDALLDAADVVPVRDIPPDVVTMNTRLRLHAEGEPAPRDITLCYPEDANAEAGLVSLLSPMGASVLGHRVGGEAEWLLPTGAVRTARIVALHFQPEAAGQYTT
ncbi:MAG: GreA/GreB family elongation factor [Aquabacterium sp.]|jgi:regulator of nucleoside diphosphate kinase|uniref:GreA/GreB family elongation factor n=1 Tax=Aquabacterium sp. TaxID=1872578 RepID=UPI002A36408B|nr:GreA/GreB family elongation factor [Aquabacterium sp.]MDX9844873.1 GreA/GreB family elongation factor [Aquabacterium sp.]